MATCEKCWRDAGGDPERYNQLIVERRDTPCTPEQQAGEKHAGKCAVCGRQTVHCVVGRCVNPECESGKAMRDLSQLLWCDLVSDEERIAFLESGRAVKTGIIAPEMVEDVVNAFRQKITADSIPWWIKQGYV